VQHETHTEEDAHGRENIAAILSNQIRHREAVHSAGEAERNGDRDQHGVNCTDRVTFPSTASSPSSSVFYQLPLPPPPELLPPELLPPDLLERELEPELENERDLDELELDDE
jgi:hypothetical protein